jgi:hypothetical protein
MSSAFLDTFDITNPSAQHSSGNEPGGPASIKAATSSFSPDTGCIRAFNLLKALVTKWIQDVSLSSDPYADVILIGLYRYLCGHGNALLHDPALHRLIYGLMTKLFKRLVHELKKLGSKLVYASFNKIIIDTNKYDYRAAKEYIDFIISATISKDLFSYLQIRTKGFHEQLLWLDPDNWGGIVLIDRPVPDDITGDSEVNIIESESGTKDKPSSAKDKINARNNDDDDDDDSFVEDEDQFSEEDFDDDNSPILTKKSQYDFLDDINDEITSSKKKRLPDDFPHFEEENQGQEDEEEYDDEVPPENNDKPIGSGNSYGLKSNWNLALFLPHPAAEYFNYIVGEYMLNYKESWETQRKLRDLQVNNMDLYNDDEMNVTSTPLTDEQLLENVKKEMKSKLQNDYLDKLIEIVQEIHIHFTNLPKEAGDPFPKLAGSYLNLKSPELEFIKSVINVNVPFGGTLMSLHENIIDTNLNAVVGKKIIRTIGGFIINFPNIKFLDKVLTVNGNIIDDYLSYFKLDDLKILYDENNEFINSFSESTGIKTHIIYTSKAITLESFNINNDEIEFKYGLGDGIVPLKSLLLPKIWNSKETTFIDLPNLEHSSILFSEKLKEIINNI